MAWNRLKSNALSGVALALSAVALAACTSGGGKAANAQSGTAAVQSGTAAAQSKTVSIMLVDQPSTEELKSKFIPDFEQKTGIHVNVDLVPESGMDAKLALALSKNQGQYDVVMVGAKNWNTAIAGHWLQPLDSYVASADTPSGYISGFPSQLMQNIKVNGKTYVMPYTVGADMLFYNKDMFKSAGLDPNSPPTTLDEVIADAKKLNKPGQAGFVGRGTRSGNENSFTWIMMWFLDGGRWADASGQPKYDVLTEPPAVEATQQYQELLKQYGPKGVDNYGFAEAQLAMQQGKAAMWLDAAQLGPALDDPAKSKIAGHVGYATLQGKGQDSIVGAVWGLSMVANTTHSAAAWKLITYLTGKDVSVAQAVSGTNGSPARTDALSDPSVQKAFNPDFAKALATAIAHANPNYTPLIPQGSQIREAVSLALSKILSGQAEPQAALEEANNQIKNLVK